VAKKVKLGRLAIVAVVHLIFFPVFFGGKDPEPSGEGT
jgi:hypothetical protein